MRDTIILDKVNVKLGGSNIVTGVSATLEAGRITAIVGSNGAGKSTLLKALCGEHAFCGHISIGGMNVARTDSAMAARRRAVLPQHTTLVFPLLVDEVVRLGQIAPVGCRKAQANQRLEALARVGLSDHAQRPYHDLSGGEQQRVQMARVLLQVWEPVDPANGQARWLFLDEPVSSLDVRHQIQLMDSARDFARAGGGVLAVMHDLNLTAHYADHLMIMKNGQLASSGALRDVFTSEQLSAAYDHPVSVNGLPAANIPFVLPLPAR